MKLPTGDCAGKSLKAPNCFFANIVTDVVVQAPDKFGNKGGAVLAAVGWRDGTRKNFNGIPESPANGLYSSASGAAGSFEGSMPPPTASRRRHGSAASRWASPRVRSRTTATSTPSSRTPSCFNSGSLTGLDVPDPLGLGLTATPTVAERDLRLARLRPDLEADGERRTIAAAD